VTYPLPAGAALHTCRRLLLQAALDGADAATGPHRHPAGPRL